MQPLIPINFIKNHSSFHNHSFNHQPKNNISPLESDTNLSLLFDETKNKNRTTREKKREREKEKRLWTKVIRNGLPGADGVPRGARKQRGR